MNIPEIAFITAFDKHSIVYTLKGEYTTHLSLDKLEERLQNCGFMRVQRSYIVNLNMINEFVPWFNNTYGMKLMGF
ncbi:MAG: LytTR family transcriptional regulator, partial [Erysipelotrichaceae bacterium]|nr:LytTR family transcriptional regulator [Erysipelotrichaceae bacterium]